MVSEHFQGYVVSSPPRPCRRRQSTSSAPQPPIPHPPSSSESTTSAAERHRTRRLERPLLLLQPETSHHHHHHPSSASEGEEADEKEERRKVGDNTRTPPTPTAREKWQDEQRLVDVMDGEKEVPKHPWEEPAAAMSAAAHASLALKTSLPPDLKRVHLPTWNQLLSVPAEGDGMGVVRSGSSSHAPVARTVSDSYSQQQARNKANFAASRRKLESEDSSYDSDHDNSHDHHQQQQQQQQQQDGGQFLQQAQLFPARVGVAGLKLPFVQISKSHDDVSRTPSETLGAEFREYVTLQKPAGGQCQQQHPIVRSREGSPGLIPHLGAVIPDHSEHDLDDVKLDPSYNGKVEFALRLGYTEELLQRALCKLGHSAGQNQLLEELIRLQKAKPGSNPVEAAESNVSVPSATLSADSAALSSGRAAAKSLSPSPKQQQDVDLQPIVIDGSNVAMSHGNKEVFSCRGIRLCVSWFQARGHRDICVFVPKWRKETSRPDTPITDQAVLTELEKERLLFYTPSRQVRGRRYVCHDDRYILNLAKETGAVVVSNDNYRDLINDKAGYNKVIEEKILMYSFVNDRFMPPDDPLGRNGPTLDQFLRRRPAAADQQPCPYGKKCTYGNKCKFFHAERGNQPQKSVTDKIKEASQHMINQVRARESTSRESSPGDQLTRTMSMQPLLLLRSGNDAEQDGNLIVEKQALCRTRSTFPRVSNPVNVAVTDQQQQQQQQQQQPLPLHVPYWKQQGKTAPSPVAVAEHPQAHQTLSLGPPPFSQQQEQGAGGGRSYSTENVSRLPPTAMPPPPPPSRPPPPPPLDGPAWPRYGLPVALCPFGTSVPPPPPPPLPNTSLPPPPPRSPWRSPAEPSPPFVAPAPTAANQANAHRKLARQLTLNPTYDPRIHTRATGDFSVPPPPAGVPPPTQQDLAGRHSSVTRNASAPDQVTSVLSAAPPHSQVALEGGTAPPLAAAAKPPLSAASGPHSHLLRMSSTSDSQLHKTLSDAVAAAAAWSRPPPPESKTAAAAAAVSPLIDASSDVWDTKSTSSASGGAGSAGSEDPAASRSKLYYHLAAVFPEDQVLAAMRALPDETDAEKICKFILSISPQQQL